jgi:hypothetical protein
MTPKRRRLFVSQCLAFAKMSWVAGLRLPVGDQFGSTIHFFDGAFRFGFSIDQKKDEWVLIGWFADRPLERMSNRGFYAIGLDRPVLDEMVRDIIRKLHLSRQQPKNGKPRIAA